MTRHLWPDALIGIIGALILIWPALVVTLMIVRPRGCLLREALRLLPDVLRLSFEAAGLDRNKDHLLIREHPFGQMNPRSALGDKAGDNGGDDQHPSVDFHGRV